MMRDEESRRVVSAGVLGMVIPPAAYVAVLRLTPPQGVDPSGRATLLGLQLVIWVCFGAPAILIIFAILAARWLLPGTASLRPRAEQRSEGEGEG